MKKNNNSKIIKQKDRLVQITTNIVSTINKFFNNNKLSRQLALFLIGDIGSGKTELTKLIAQQLSINPAQVTSPTFTTIKKLYSPKYNLYLYHLDLFKKRKNTDNDTLIDEILEYVNNNNNASDRTSKNLLIIEWADNINKDEEKLISLDWKIFKLYV